jgi:uncharacterized protein YjbI with pentapeptide repeats
MALSNQSHENQNFNGLTDVNRDLTRKIFTQCTFKQCDFSGCRLSGSTFTDCRFTDCNLANIKVDQCSFQTVEFKACKIVGVVFATINPLLIDWSFSGCLVELCNFDRLKMRRTKFVDCTIKETDFVETDLTESDFTGSDLQGSKFQTTNLEKADFSKAKSYYIDPKQNRIRQAKFSYPEVLGLLEPLGILMTND